jgi:hypothetical protein
LLASFHLSNKRTIYNSSALKKSWQCESFCLEEKFQPRCLGLKTFIVENKGEKEEVDILKVQALLPQENKLGSVVVTNFTSFDGLIILGQITKVWQQDQFKPWK